MDEFLDVSDTLDITSDIPEDDGPPTSELDNIPAADEMIPYCRDVDEGMENILQYRKGGYHPIHIGDILNDRFEVVNKLGSGGFGIVWLCLDVKFHKWRAVKVMMADHSSKETDIKIIQHLKSRASVEELLENGVVVPLEEFWVNGPNGSHHCFVMPVLGCRVDDWRRTLHWTQYESGIQPRAICHQIVKALDFLHGHGVCHGDFRPANILMQVEGIDDLDKSEVNRLVGEPELRGLKKGSPGSETWPDYCVVSLLDRGFKWTELLTTKVAIIDYGESCFISNPREFCGIPKPYAAPELLFGGNPSVSSDIWALTCTLYQIRTSRKLFEVTGWEDDEMSEIVGAWELPLGPLPEPYRTVWYEKGYGQNSTSDDDEIGIEQEHHPDEKDPQTETTDGPVAWGSVDEIIETREGMQSESGFDTIFQAIVGEERQITKREPDSIGRKLPRHKYRFSRQEIFDLADLLESVLKWDPTERRSLDEILHHPWLEEQNLLKATGTISRVSVGYHYPLVGVLLVFIVFIVIYGVEVYRDRQKVEVEFGETGPSQVLHNYHDIGTQIGEVVLSSCYCHFVEFFRPNIVVTRLRLF